jgi:hypothetical protein
MIIVYVVHILLLNKNVESHILHGEVPDEYFLYLRNKIILLGRLTVGLSIGILFLAALLDRGAVGIF